MSRGNTLSFVDMNLNSGWYSLLAKSKCHSTFVLCCAVLPSHPSCKVRKWGGEGKGGERGKMIVGSAPAKKKKYQCEGGRQRGPLTSTAAK